MFSRILIFICFYFVFIGSCFPAQRTWYPKAEDTCAKFLLDRIDKNAKLITPTKDPAIAKLVTHFKTANRIDEKKGEALVFFDLFAYCNTHALTKLGDISAQELADILSPNIFDNNSSNSTSPKVPNEATASTNVNGEAMMKCLQDTLRSTIEACRKNNCPMDTIAANVRVAQQAACGFSAIDPEKPISMPPIYPTTSNCTSIPQPGGGLTTECTQF